MDHGSKELRDFLCQQVKGGFASQFSGLVADPMDLFQRVTIMPGGQLLAIVFLNDIQFADVYITNIPLI
jgi:hypothetical protein